VVGIENRTVFHEDWQKEPIVRESLGEKMEMFAEVSPYINVLGLYEWMRMGVYKKTRSPHGNCQEKPLPEIANEHAYKGDRGEPIYKTTRCVRKDKEEASSNLG